MKEIDKRAFGLTKEQFGKLVFDFAEKRKINHRFKKQKKTCGRHFIEWFMKEYKVSLRTPESTSIARLMAFNKENVSQFYNVLREAREKYLFQPHQIYNVDETGVSTVATKNPKILTPKGKRRVIKISSAERGTNVTAVCSMNGSGNFVPPFLIFPRVRMNPAYMNNTPSDFVGVAHESGWMTSDNFVKYLEHFIRYTRPSEDNKILLLMDNHASHVTLEAVMLCRENFITLIGFPAHTSHRLQPLDVSIYGPLKTAYSRACEHFLTNNPGKVISLYDIASIFSTAYLKVASVANAKSGFRATGIEPFNPDIFLDTDFETAKTTEIEPKTMDQNLNVEIEIQELRGEKNETDISTPNKTEPMASSSKSISSKERTMLGLPPLPQGSQKTRRPRKKLPSLVISSTPVKDALQAKSDEKLEKEKNKKLREEAKLNKQKNRLNIKKAKIKQKANNVKRKVFISSDSESSEDIAYADTDDDIDLEFEGDCKLCLICSDVGKDNELWFRCSTCQGWAHAQCTTINSKEAKDKAWICDFCV